jgi:hypothetical protein
MTREIEKWLEKVNDDQEEKIGVGFEFRTRCRHPTLNPHNQVNIVAFTAVLSETLPSEGL